MGAYPHEESDAVCIKAGLTSSGGKQKGKQAAANVIAGTTGLDYIGALNVAAGNPKNAYRDHEGVLNQLAGTTGWGANAAASRWAGLL